MSPVQGSFPKGDLWRLKAVLSTGCPVREIRSLIDRQRPPRIAAVSRASRSGGQAGLKRASASRPWSQPIPGWRFLNNATERRRRQAADLHLQLAGAPRGSEQAQQLQAAIRTADRHLEGLRTARRESGRKVRAGEISEEDRLQVPTTPLWDLLDAPRMIVDRAETRLVAALGPGLSRPETAWTLVKAMFSSDASVVPDPSAETVTVRRLH